MSDKIYKNLNSVQKSLQCLIPGYKNYLNASEAIESDYTIRSHITKVLNALIGKIDSKKTMYISSLDSLPFLSALEKISMSLKSAAEAVEYSSGAGGSFNYNSSDTNRIEKLKSYDEFLYFSLQEIKTLIDGVEKAVTTAELDSAAKASAVWSAGYIDNIRSRKDLF